VGSNACKTCHADVWLNFYKNPHFKSLASGKEPPDKTGCEGCHGPAKAHLEARGGKTTIPRAFSLMPPKQALDTCLGCHARDFSRANIRRSEHTLHDVACNSCHSIHRSPTPKYLLARNRASLLRLPRHNRAHPKCPPSTVNAVFMQCTDCHNPHGAFAATRRMAQRPRMEAGAEYGDPCLKCHADKRARSSTNTTGPRGRLRFCHSSHGP
jgi:DmsE family decaheme c-type cytochrome